MTQEHEISPENLARLVKLSKDYAAACEETRQADTVLADLRHRLPLAEERFDKAYAEERQAARALETFAAWVGYEGPQVVAPGWEGGK